VLDERAEPARRPAQSNSGGDKAVRLEEPALLARPAGARALRPVAPTARPLGRPRLDLALAAEKRQTTQEHDQRAPHERIAQERTRTGQRSGYHRSAAGRAARSGGDA